MSRRLGRGVKSALRAAAFALMSPFAPLARARQGERLVVLAYHDPSAEVLGGHLDALARHYTFVSLPEALSAVAEGKPLPPRPLAVTLDDGSVGNARVVPECRDRGVRPALFVCTQVTGRYWWSGVDPLEQRRLKGVPDAERRAATARSSEGPRESLTPTQLTDLAADADIMPHTRTHPVLPRCTDEVARDEIAGSREDLETLLGAGCSCDVFAYPNGDFGDRDVAVTAESGYRFALTTSPGFVDAASEPLKLPRIVVRDDASPHEAVVRASGIPGALQRLTPRRIWSALQVR